MTAVSKTSRRGGLRGWQNGNARSKLSPTASPRNPGGVTPITS